LASGQAGLARPQVAGPVPSIAGWTMSPYGRAAASVGRPSRTLRMATWHPPPANSSMERYCIWAGLAPTPRWGRRSTFRAWRPPVAAEPQELTPEVNPEVHIQFQLLFVPPARPERRPTVGRNVRPGSIGTANAVCRTGC